MKIPKPKSQIPRKTQTPNLKPMGHSFGSWDLGFVWDLGFGIWDFSGAWCLVLGAFFLTGCQHTQPRYADLPGVSPSASSPELPAAGTSTLNNPQIAPSQPRT